MGEVWPRMMYGEWPEYKVAQNSDETGILEAQGYVFEPWPDRGDQPEPQNET